jgi:hypothetical protein
VGTIGGYYNPSIEFTYQPLDHDGMHLGAITSAVRFLNGWRYIKEHSFVGADGSTSYPVSQRRWSEANQMMAFYPIAYAVRKTRDDLNFFDGIDMAGEETINGVSRDVEFRLIQAAKTHLYLADVVEGDMKLKVLQPYQGMGSYTMYNRWGDGSNTFPDFRQSYPYSMGGDFPYRRISSEPGYSYDYDAGEGGKMYSWTKSNSPFTVTAGGQDFEPYPQSYLDKMFNQQKS